MNEPLPIPAEFPSDHAETAALLAKVASAHGQDLVARFYQTLLLDGEAKQFLDHSVVQDRLTSSLRDWLTELFAGEDIRCSFAQQARQKTIGEVHARIKIPMHLVMKGAMAIKSLLAEILADEQTDPAQALQALQLANMRMDTAVMLISQSYVKDTTARARLDEAYRLFSLDQDVAVEKETQRASLMEWSQNILFTLLQGGGGEPLMRLHASPFGLWLRHRAQFMFEQSTAFGEVMELVLRVDEVLLPRLEGAGARENGMDALTELRAAVDEISFLIADLFQALKAMEGGRDPLTRTLNRRFLPAILGREVTFAQERNSPLCVMLIDVDHFKAINDRRGHQAGDDVLRQVAQVITESVRPTDFVFRYGGEEFLVLLAETKLEGAIRIAERIRQDVARREFDAGSLDTLQVTASIGIARHAGHPDQKYLIKAADEALYRAKANGRNRIELADSV